MSPKDLLQGKWLGHPLHPAVVHVPTGLFPAALVFDLLALAAAPDGDNAAVQCSFWSLAIGLAAVLVAVPTGLADWSDIKPDKPARKLGVYHLSLNVLVTLLMAASLWLRWRHGSDASRPPIAAVALCALGNVVLAVSGYLGGRMVYQYGIGVARLSKQRWRKVAEAGGARLPEEKAASGS
jgi:uncharacterized membrane protein